MKYLCGCSDSSTEKDGPKPCLRQAGPKGALKLGFIKKMELGNKK